MQDIDSKVAELQNAFGETNPERFTTMANDKVRHTETGLANELEGQGDMEDQFQFQFE